MLIPMFILGEVRDSSRILLEQLAVGVATFHEPLASLAEFPCQTKRDSGQKTGRREWEPKISKVPPTFFPVFPSFEGGPPLPPVFPRFFYMAMSLTGMVLVHSDELAVGGPRPVYTLRFVQWCACVPLLMLAAWLQMVLRKCAAK